MFPIRWIALQAGGTEGFLLCDRLTVPVFRRGRRILLIFLPICGRLRILRILLVRGRIGGLVFLLRGHFCGRRCLLSLAGARFGGLFRIQIVRTPDLIGPLSGFCILGPLDGVVLALCQLLLDVRVALPLLGSGAAGHSEPDDGDQCTIFPLFIGGIRTQTEGVVKVLPGFLAREGDEYRPRSDPHPPEIDFQLLPQTGRNQDVLRSAVTGGQNTSLLHRPDRHPVQLTYADPCQGKDLHHQIRTLPAQIPGCGQQAQILSPAQLRLDLLFGVQLADQLQIPPPQIGQQPIGGGHMGVGCTERVAFPQQGGAPELQCVCSHPLVLRKKVVKRLQLGAVDLDRLPPAAPGRQAVQIPADFFPGNCQLRRRRGPVL